MNEIGRPPERPGLPDPTPPNVQQLLQSAERYGLDIVGPPLSPASAPRERQASPQTQQR